MKRLSLVFIIFIFGIIILIFVNTRFCESYYTGVLGSILAAFFAAFLVWVAWEELGKLSKTSSADFIHRLDNDFFTSETRKLVALVDCEALDFKDPSNDESQSVGETDFLAYFEVNLDNLKKTNLPEEIIKSISKKNYYSTWEVDDLLLGLFENIGMLEQRRIIGFQMVYDVFSWYLETTWKNYEIKKYIMYCRKDDNNARIETVFYYYFQYIVTKCLEYGTLHSGPCLLWWKIKRYFRRPKINAKINIDI